jgi:hypothetical protein
MSCGRLVLARAYCKKFISLWIAFFRHDSSNSWIFIWLEQLRLLHDYSHPREHCQQGRRLIERHADVTTSNFRSNNGTITAQTSIGYKYTNIRPRRLHFGHGTKQEHGHTSSFALFDDVLHINRHKHPEQTFCSFRDTYVLQSTISYFFPFFSFA